MTWWQTLLMIAGYHLFITTIEADIRWRKEKKNYETISTTNFGGSRYFS